MQRARVALAELAVLAGALAIYVSVTAQAGTTTVNLPLPSGPTLLWGIIAAIFGEVGRRILKRLDTVVDNTSKLWTEFTTFKATVNTALMGVDERGGLLQNDRETRVRLERLETGDYRHTRKGEDEPRPHRRVGDNAPEKRP